MIIKGNKVLWCQLYIMWEQHVAFYSNLSTMYYNCWAEIFSVHYHSNVEFFHETLTAIAHLITHGNANCNPYTLIWKAEGGFGWVGYYFSSAL